jgi:hypothetical protein
MAKTFVAVDFNEIELTEEQLEAIAKNKKNQEKYQTMVTKRNQTILGLGNQIANSSEKMFINFFQNPYVDASLNALFTLFRFPTMGYFNHLALGQVIENSESVLSFVSPDSLRKFEWKRTVSFFTDYEGDTHKTIETFIPDHDKKYLESLIPQKDIANGAKDFHHYVDGKEVMGYPVVEGFFANELKNQFFITLALKDVPHLLNCIEKWRKGEMNATKVLRELGFRISLNVGVSFLSAFSNLIIMALIQSFVKKAGPATYTITFMVRLATSCASNSVRNFIIYAPKKEIKYDNNVDVDYDV